MMQVTFFARYGAAASCHKGRVSRPTAPDVASGCGGRAARATYVGQGGRMGSSRAVRERRRLRRDLRETVFALRSGTRLRLFAPELHVGTLGGTAVTYPAADAPDLGLRAEIAAALVSRALGVTSFDLRGPEAWLTRVGMPEPHDLDLAWLPPLRRAFAEAGLAPRCVAVVTKHGWYDPVLDQRVVWDRLRIREH